MNASPSYNDFYFISDLDRTLIYSKRAIQESDPEYCKNLIPIEYKDGRQNTAPVNYDLIKKHYVFKDPEQQEKQ